MLKKVGLRENFEIHLDFQLQNCSADLNRFKSISKSISDIQISRTPINLNMKSRHCSSFRRGLRGTWICRRQTCKKTSFGQLNLSTGKFFLDMSVRNRIPTFRGVLDFKGRHVQDIAALKARTTSLPLTVWFLLSVTQRHVPQEWSLHLRGCENYKNLRHLTPDMNCDRWTVLRRRNGTKCCKRVLNAWNSLPNCFRRQ